MLPTYSPYDKQVILDPTISSSAVWKHNCLAPAEIAEHSVRMSVCLEWDARTGDYWGLTGTGEWLVRAVWK